MTNEKTPRLRFSNEACSRLQLIYDSGNIKPSRQLREELGKELGKSARSIQIWFQNKRAKAKRRLVVDIKAVESNSNSSLSPKEPYPSPGIQTHSLQNMLSNGRLANSIQSAKPSPSAINSTDIMNRPDIFPNYYPITPVSPGDVKRPRINTNFNRGPNSQMSAADYIYGGGLASAGLPATTGLLSAGLHRASGLQSAGIMQSSSLPTSGISASLGPQSQQQTSQPLQHFNSFSLLSPVLQTPTTTMCNGFAGFEFFKDSDEDLDPVEFMKWVGSS